MKNLGKSFDDQSTQPLGASWLHLDRARLVVDGLFSCAIVVLLLFFSTTLFANERIDGMLLEGLSSSMAHREKSAIVRSRLVDADISKVLGATPSQRQRNGGQGKSQVVLNLFDDVVAKVDHKKNYSNRSGSLTWVGEAESVANSTVVFVVKGELLYGVAELPGIGSFSIRPNHKGAHLVEEVNGAALLSGESDFVILSDFKAPVKSVTRSVDTSSDDGSIIDVYVAYDQDEVGGSVAAADAQAFAELFIAYTNQAYENSNIDQRVWLVGTVDGYNYNDTDTSTLSDDLQAAKGGSLSGLHDKRDEYHADLVMFFVPLVDGCSGLASLQLTNDSLYFSESAYATMEACSYGQGVFAHELGHNMGSRHDWYMDSGTTPDSIAHGYVDWINGFRTIMSYNNRCTAIGISCERIPRFSNPAVRHGGHVVGVAKGTSTSCEEGEKFPSLECDADSATLFNNKAATTAKFRDSRLTWNGGVDSNWANAANWNINEGAPGATVVNNRVPRSFDNLFIPGDPGLSFSPPIYNGSYNDPNITAGTLSARELVIADGAQLSMSGGTLNVGWRWQDLGGFKATGGTVEFSGPIGVTVDSSSAFQSIRVGSGTDSSVVSLANNLDVDDDLTISAGAILDAGNYTINLAGNWQEQGPTGFRASTSTVIFDGDGVAQSVNKASSSVVFTEDFSEGDNQDGFSTAYMPPGWSGENWFFGEHSGDGEALASGNAWLYSQSVTLDKNATYTLTLDFDQSYNSDDVLRVYYGKEVSPSDMTEVGSVSTTGTSNFEFKVPASGTYYVGFYHEKAGESGMSYMDNVGLSAYSGLNFYNLRVASGYVTVNEAITIENELRIDAGATLDTEDNVLTLNGTLINEGTLKGSVDQAGSCSKLEVTLNPSDYDTVSSEIMIKSEGIITLDYGASVTYRAPEIRLLPGFSALPGSSMVAKAEAVSCSGG